MATRSAGSSTVPADGPIEQLYEQGVTDGFPVVPPTRDSIETLLKDRHGVAEVVRHARPSPARMAKPEVRYVAQEIQAAAS